MARDGDGSDDDNDDNDDDEEDDDGMEADEEAAAAEDGVGRVACGSEKGAAVVFSRTRKKSNGWRM
jgi:hypothetical protein